MLRCSDIQLCLTLCDPMGYSPPGSSVHGILPARILEWVVISSSKGSSRCRDQTCISYISCIGRQVLYLSRHCVVVQSPICVQLFVTPWTAALPISHHLLEFVQVHVHSISAAIQPFHPLRPSSPSALDLSQHNESSVRMR